MSTGKEEIFKILLKVVEGPKLKASQDNLAQAAEKLRLLKKKVENAQEQGRQLESEIATLKAKRDGGDYGGEDIAILSRQLAEKEKELENLRPWIKSLQHGPGFNAAQREIEAAKGVLSHVIDAAVLQVRRQYEERLNDLLAQARTVCNAWEEAVSDLFSKFHSRSIRSNRLSVDSRRSGFDG